jgi:ribonucleotide reductase beta subunit family protein with ferritin-like domain
MEISPFRRSMTYKPFAFPWSNALAIRHENAHWLESEIDLADDIHDWKTNRLTQIEKDYITNILRLFTQSDVAVASNYADFLIPTFHNNEIRQMLLSFASRECTHQRSYSLLNDSLGLPDSEYHAFLGYSQMSKKLEYMTDLDMSSDDQIALSLIKCVFSEGLSLFASFAMLLNFQRSGRMKGMGKVVEWSIRDETMHVEGLCQLFHTVGVRPLYSRVFELCETFVRLEDAFIDLAYEKIGVISGLSCDDMKRYVRYIADHRMIQLQYEPVFAIGKNPLPWLDWIVNAVDHTNFFENKITEYDVAGLRGTWAY